VSEGGIARVQSRVDRPFEALDDDLFLTDQAVPGIYKRAGGDGIRRESNTLERELTRPRQDVFSRTFPADG
jgi:hypothetical protein